MEQNDDNNIIDYKLLYYDMKDKYDKLSMELEELKIDNKLKEEEINLLRKKINLNIINIDNNNNKDSSFLKGEDPIFNFNDNSMVKQSSKKFDTYSVDSFRNDPEQANDLLQELMKNEIDEIKIQKMNNYKNIMKIEQNYFQIISNKSIGDNNKNIINKTLTGDIDAILLNIKMKQKSLYQTQKMFNLQNDKV